MADTRISDLFIKGFVHLTFSGTGAPFTIAVHTIALFYPDKDLNQKHCTSLQLTDSNASYFVTEDYHEVLRRIQQATQS
jgi:hypothetical protein